MEVIIHILFSTTILYISNSSAIIHPLQFVVYSV